MSFADELRNAPQLKIEEDNKNLERFLEWWYKNGIKPACKYCAQNGKTSAEFSFSEFILDMQINQYHQYGACIDTFPAVRDRIAVIVNDEYADSEEPNYKARLSGRDADLIARIIKKWTDADGLKIIWKTEKTVDGKNLIITIQW